jgi:hypothetical protein
MMQAEVMAETLGSDELEFLIAELPPYTNYTIRVQALGTNGVLGDVEEVINRTHSTIPAAPLTSPVTATPPDLPSTTMVTVLIADPTQIRTGRVM